MRYLDEYRAGDVVQAHRRRNRARDHAAVGHHGGLRRPDALHRSLRHRPDAATSVELVHGPGCPVCVTSLEMIDRAHAIASRARRRSSARSATCCACPGRAATSSRCGAAARTCASSTRRSTPSRSRGRTRDRRVVFFAIGFETTAPANAMAVQLAQARGREQLLDARLARARAAGDGGHPADPGQPRAGVPGPRPRLRGHGLREYEALAQRYRVPIVVTGFEPVDLLEGVLLLRAAARRRARRGREPVLADGVARREPRGPQAHRRGVRGRRPQVARRRDDPEVRLPAALRSTATTTPSASSRSTPSRREESAVCISGQVLRGLKKPARLPGVRQGVHAADPARRDDGVRRGRVRRLPPVRAPSGRDARRWEKTMSSEPSVCPGGPGGCAARARCPVPFAGADEILLGHGSGGKLTARLIEETIVPALHNPLLAALDDQAFVPVASSHVAFTTDSFVVTPIVFPGGDIGELAVNGTVNDLAMGGATPLYLSLAFILEEGLPLAELRRILASVRRAADRANVVVVTGDTKVVGRGSADKLFVNTAGIGAPRPGVRLSSDRVRPGDAILLSGTIGDHGMAILALREGLELEGSLVSDTAPLHGLVAAMLDAFPDIHAMRDPTRGGLAATLVEIAIASRPRHRGRRVERPGEGGRSRSVRDPRARPAPRRERGQARRVRPRRGQGRGARLDARPSAGARCGVHRPRDVEPPRPHAAANAHRRAARARPPVRGGATADLLRLHALDSHEAAQRR